MNIVQHFYTSTEFLAAQSDWLTWQLIYLDWASYDALPYNQVYGPMTTYNEAYGPMTTYNELWSHDNLQ